jgi:hypothetical protein
MFFWPGWHEIYERANAQVRAIAGEAIWEEAIAEGERLSMQQALALALEELQSH